MVKERCTAHPNGAPFGEKSVNQLLLDIVSKIVDHPEEVSVEEIVDEQGSSTLRLKVHQEDIGRVIGKEGKIITALRTLMRLAAMKQGKRVRVDLVEPPAASHQAPSQVEPPQAEETP